MGGLQHNSVRHLYSTLIQANSYNTPRKLPQLPETIQIFVKNAIGYGNYPPRILTALPTLSAAHINQCYFNLFLPLLISVMVGFICITIISLSIMVHP